MASFTYEIDYNPQPEDVGTVQLSVCITKFYQSIGLCDDGFYEEQLTEFSRFPISSRNYIDVDQFTQVLAESGEITHMDAYVALLNFFRLVDEVTSYTPGCALRVWMTLNVVFVPPEIEEEDLSDIVDDHDLEESDLLHIGEDIMGLLDELSISDDNIDIEIVIEHDHEEVARSQVEELVRVSFNETTIRFKPANKLVVNSLNSKIYNKSSGETDTCTICLEEYKNGGKIIILPCGHEFDDECILEWFTTNHICPLCRFELPCEDDRGELGLVY